MARKSIDIELREAETEELIDRRTYSVDRWRATEVLGGLEDEALEAAFRAGFDPVDVYPPEADLPVVVLVEAEKEIA